MKVFISHSWKDKTAAETLANDIGPICDQLWLDARQIHPELTMAPDLVLLIWSRQAAQAQNIHAVINTGLALNKKLIPCVLDDTPLPAALHAFRCIYMLDYSAGFCQLLLAILDTSSLNILLDGEPATRVTRLEQLCGRLRNHPAAMFKEIETVATHVLRTCRQLQNPEDKETNDAVQMLSRTHATADDWERLQSLLYEMTLEGSGDIDVLHHLRYQLEQRLQTIPVPSTTTLLPATSQLPFQPMPTLFKEVLSHTEKTKVQINQALQEQVIAEDLQHAADCVHYYILSTVDMLDLLHDITLSSESPGQAYILKSLYRYVQTPRAASLDADQAIWTLIETAWIIQNTTYRCIEAGLFAHELLPFTWTKIVTADAIVVRTLPAHQTQRLTDLLMLFIQVIARDNQSYQPQFCHDESGYYPYMGQAPALDMALDGIGCLAHTHW